MPNLEEHLGEFDDLGQRHLADVRKQRRRVLADMSLDPIQREVLGLTGSGEELKKYERLVGKIGECVGQPIVRIQHISNEGTAEQVVGGYISGDVFVKSRSFDLDREFGRASGHAILAVPVRRFVSVHDYRQSEFAAYTGDQVREDSVVAAHIINHEWENRTHNPDKDFYEGLPQDHLLIGHEAIYGSPLFLNGLSKAMVAIEAADRDYQASLTALGSGNPS